MKQEQVAKLDEAMELVEEVKSQIVGGVGEATSGPSLNDDTPDSIRFPVSKELYEELRDVAHRRRVTVRYLCLEALAKTGFKVDLENLPVDGRRVKKRR